ncbi:hypothetical protein CONLIGDRAFT_635492 [Coniochaeta ligniaria NRRL 30616]|uniref:Uncharacterized protein n=1 Tax=Coniochaeta ligniaria NRRL 30616 TaxID=1408157 RepID=A0A1J7IDY3_9PEZI|nr:hypothetical protein CONLIGDRAFT_635492 [Coniochaeta ligniaria NRRL 30616]
MSTTTRKRSLSDTASIRDQEPPQKMRKTTDGDDGDETVTTILINSYRLEIKRKEEDITALEEANWKYVNDEADLLRQLLELKREREQARIDNQALTEEVADMKVRLPENQSTIPAYHIRNMHRSLELRIAGFIDTYIVDNVQAPPSSHHLFAPLTRITGPMMADRKTRSLLFQAWIWKFIHQSILTRYSTFWAGDWGKDTMTSFDEERAAMTDIAELDELNRFRSEDVNHLLSLVPANKAEKIHALALEMFDFFFNRLQADHDDIYLGHVMTGLKHILGAAAEFDVVLRRSKGDHTVDLPSAGFFSCNDGFDGDMLKVCHYRDGGEEVVLVVSPIVYRRGTTEGEGIGEEWVAIKARVVVGLGEEEGEVGVQVEVGEEEWKEGVVGWVMGKEEKEEKEEEEEDGEKLPGEESTCVDSEWDGAQD